MTEAQRQHWEMLLEIDASDARFKRAEIDFIAGIIDANPSREGSLTVGEMATIRAMHRAKVQGAADEDDEL